jgi:predicted Zn finger-like uncharacterized protein
MKFECDSCNAQYMIADEKVGKRGVKVKCKRCSHVIVVRPDKPGGDVSTKADKGQPAAVGDVSKAGALDTLSSTTESVVAADAKSSRSRPAATPSTPEETGAGRPAPVPLAADTQMGASLGGVGNDDGASGAWEGDKTELGTDPSPLDPPPHDHAAGEDLPRPPDALAASAWPSIPASSTMPSVKGESSIGDALDDQLAGAFNQMFDEGRPGVGDLAGLVAQLGVPTGDQQRGPTQILDLDAMNALRRATAQPSADIVDSDGLDALRRDFGQGQDESSGLWNEQKHPAQPASSAPRGGDDGPDEPEWHVAIDDEDIGPITLAELGRHIESGAVDRMSLVWKAGMGDWIAAEQVDRVRGLFLKVPMPKIAPASTDTALRSKKSKPASFDLGTPIDDLPARGASPFDGVPGMGMEESNPNWRPHGLTDVYQAANLAEAAGGAGAVGGLIGNASSAARGGISGSPSAAEPEWRPSASSALANLVNDEIDRLSKGPLPATDDDLGPRPADDNALGGTLPFSSLAGVDLDAGAAISDGGRPAPRFSSMGSPKSPEQGFQPQGLQQQQQPQGFQQPGFGGGFPQQAQPPPRSPLVLVGVVGVALLFVMVSLLAYKVVFDKPAQQVVMVGPNGLPIQPGMPLSDPGTQVAALTPPPAPAPPPPPPPTPAVEPAAVPPVPPAAPTEPTPVAAATESPPTPPTPVKVASNDTKKPPTRDKPVVEKPVVEKAVVVPPVVEKAPAKASAKCDPVLDFDCKTGGAGSGASEPAVAAKATLEKSDILAVVKGALPKVKACGAKGGGTGTIKMTWKIAKNGKPTDVAVSDSKYGGTPVGACVTQVVQSMRFPAYTGASPPPVSIPLPLG